MCAQVLYMPSGQVARKLGISPRTLGKITGNLYAQMSDGTKEDIGLFVKHGSKGLCVPDYVQAKPEDRGWAYSQALLQVLEQYKVRQRRPHASSNQSRAFEVQSSYSVASSNVQEMLFFLFEER